MTERKCPVCGGAMIKTELDIDYCKSCHITIHCSFMTLADRLQKRVAELEKENETLRNQNSQLTTLVNAGLT